MKSLRYILLCLVCLALFGCATLDVTEQTFLQPDEGPPPVATLGADYALENIAVTHADGEIGHGILLTNPSAVATVLYFGGSDFRIDRESRRVITALAKVPVNIVMLDYRGYGRSQGEPSTELLKSDALDTLRFVKARTQKPLLVYGLSLGSFVACALAESQAMDGLILEGANANAQESIASLIPWYARPFVDLRIQPKLLLLDNAHALRAYRGPLLMLAGADDTRVPVSLQQAFFARLITPNKTMQIFPHYGHKGLIESPDFPAVFRHFLAQLPTQSNATARLP